MTHARTSQGHMLAAPSTHSSLDPSAFLHPIRSFSFHSLSFHQFRTIRNGLEWTRNGDPFSLILPHSVPLNPSLSLPIVNCHLSNPGHRARNDVSEEHVRQEAAEEEESKFMLYLHTDTLNQGRHKSLFHRSHSIPFIQYTTGLSIFLSFFPGLSFHFSLFILPRSTCPERRIHIGSSTGCACIFYFVINLGIVHTNIVGLLVRWFVLSCIF